MRLRVRTILHFAALVALLVAGALQLRAGASSAVKSGIDLSTIDYGCKPCSDFYEFANGAWLKATRVPAEKSYYGTIDILADKNIAAIHEILDEIARSHPLPGSNEQKVADFYNSCMNVDAIFRAGVAPLSSDLHAIDGLSDLRQLPSVLATLQLDGVSAFFIFSRQPDFQTGTTNIAGIDQGGLGLPDRDYYTKTDGNSVELRKLYLMHVYRMFSLLGEDDQSAADGATIVMAMETALAKHQLTDVQELDTEDSDNRHTLAQLDSLSPNFKWSGFFLAMGVAPTVASVTSPAYLSALSTELAGWRLDEIKTYLKWRLLDADASALPQRFRDEHFAFFSETLEGITIQPPRWKECARSVDQNLGQALGPMYVAKVFPPQAKAAAFEIVDNVERVFRNDLATQPWMSPATRELALQKLNANLIKIGYPDTWRDYSNLSIVPGPYLTNLTAARRFEAQRELAQIGGPLDRTEWSMTPPTVDAYYDRGINEIVFPAGILQPPFFDANADPAVNYGAIGAVVGHESTHGFDDQGSAFDKNGTMSDQWTIAERLTFLGKTQCIVKQFDQLSPLAGVPEDGRLVASEEAADLGGVALAYRAFERWQSSHPRTLIDGFTPEQRFFLGWAHVWMSVERPAAIKLGAETDVHAYDKFRVNAILSDLPEFAKAWMCPLNSPMVRPPEERCAIW
jgi:putative endopeptidase